MAAVGGDQKWNEVAVCSDNFSPAKQLQKMGTGLVVRFSVQHCIYDMLFMFAYTIIFQNPHSVSLFVQVPL